MPIHNADIAAIFSEITDLPKQEQANPFRIRSYRNTTCTDHARVELTALPELRKLPEGTR